MTFEERHMTIHTHDPATMVVGDQPAAPVHSARDVHDLLTVAEVAAWLKVSHKWVYEHTRHRRGLRSERLPHLKLGKYLRFDPRAVQAFLARKASNA
jgi:predicted DNA-binding transcriptional regulator AlpA